MTDGRRWTNPRDLTAEECGAVDAVMSAAHDDPLLGYLTAKEKAHYLSAVHGLEIGMCWARRGACVDDGAQRFLVDTLKAIARLRAALVEMEWEGEGGHKEESMCPFPGCGAQPYDGVPGPTHQTGCVYKDMPRPK